MTRSASSCFCPQYRRRHRARASVRATACAPVKPSCVLIEFLTSVAQEETGGKKKKKKSSVTCAGREVIN